MNCHRRQLLLASAAAVLAPHWLQAQGKAKPSEVPWLGEIQRVPQELPAAAPRLTPLLVDDQGQPIATVQGWERHREELRRTWLDFLGPFKLDHPRPTLEVINEDRPQGLIRQLVRYESEPGPSVEGYLIKPSESAAAPRAGVVVLHSTVP